MRNLLSSWKWLLCAALLAVALAVVLNWQGIPLGFAVASSESRPELLADANWGDAESANEFGERFASGSPERELLNWLHANRFTVDQQNKDAERLIKGLPCNELIEITWSANSGESLTASTAIVTEAGCL